MKNFFLIITTVIFLFSCTSEDQIRKTAYPDLYDGKYDSEFPYRSSSEQLEKIANTIKLVNSIAFYRVYHFDISDSIVPNSINQESLSRFLETSTTYEETASGTGTTVYYSGTNVGVLTCAHIINFPDSVATFYMTSNGKSTGFVKSFSVQVKQDIYIVPFFEEGNFEVVVQDTDLDIAILKKKIKSKPLFMFNSLDFPLGQASELNWGTFVYVFGFPANYKMISKAIVSSPGYDKKNSFIIDAVANQGMSGGVVFAIRDGVPNFELVGMVRSAPAEYEYVLRPQKDEVVILGSEYKGMLISDVRKNIKYGITKVLAIESIQNFIKENSDIIIENELDPNRFFK